MRDRKLFFKRGYFYSLSPNRKMRFVDQFKMIVWSGKGILPEIFRLNSEKFHNFIFFSLKWGASSRWTPSLYCAMRNSDRMAIKKTAPSIFSLFGHSGSWIPWNFKTFILSLNCHFCEKSQIWWLKWIPQLSFFMIFPSKMTIWAYKLKFWNFSEFSLDIFDPVHLFDRSGSTGL